MRELREEEERRLINEHEELESIENLWTLGRLRIRLSHAQFAALGTVKENAIRFCANAVSVFGTSTHDTGRIPEACYPVPTKTIS